MRIVLFLACILGLTAPAQAQDAARVAFDRSVTDAKQAMMSDPGVALTKSEQAVRQARALPPSSDARIAVATGLWLQAESLIYLNELDRAGPLVDQALAIAAAQAPRSKLRGDLTRSRGTIAAIRGDVQGALADFQAAYGLFRAAGETRSQAIALQDIGLIYKDAGDYDRTLRYYAQASELETGDPSFTLTSQNNRAEVLRTIGRSDEAEREYKKALVGARALQSPLLQVRILTNLAATQVEGGKLVAAGQTLASARRLSQAGEAAGWQPFVTGVSAELAAARGDQAGAAALIDRTFQGMDLTTTPLPFREFHALGARVFERLGRAEPALAHLKAYSRLNTEAQTLTASTSSQLLNARFDFANQNLKISQLKQGQLERDIALERQKTRLRTTVLIGLIVAGAIVLALLAVGFVSIRRSRDQVRATNAQLTEANAQLEAALEAKTEFLATTSHEIRTPLNGILGMTQVLLHDRTLAGGVRDRVEVIHGAGETMRALVDDILDLAKMDTGDIAVTTSDTHLHRILDDAVRLWRGHASGKGLSLVADIDDAPHRIRSDPARVRQIVANLLANAIKFTDAGSVRLSARAENTPDGETLLLEVSDTGIGIAPEDHDAVFQAFHQVDGGTTRRFGGTGLGLAIVGNVVEALGGRITLVSALGEGTTFSVRLPLDRIEGAQTLAPAPTDQPNRPVPRTLADARVLMIDPNPVAQGVLRSLLEPVAGLVRVAGSVDAGVDAIEAGEVDHLIIEGKAAIGHDAPPVELLRALVANASTRGVRTTILFAPSEELPANEIAALGATQVILKPVAGTALIAALVEGHSAPTGTTLDARRLDAA